MAVHDMFFDHHFAVELAANFFLHNPRLFQSDLHTLRHHIRRWSLERMSTNYRHFVHKHLADRLGYMQRVNVQYHNYCVAYHQGEAYLQMALDLHDPVDQCMQIAEDSRQRLIVVLQECRRKFKDARFPYISCPEAHYVYRFDDPQGADYFGR